MRDGSASTTRAFRPSEPAWRVAGVPLTNIYDAAEGERGYSPKIEKLLLKFFPDAIDALVYNHDVFDKDYQGDRTEDQDGKNPGVNANYANLVHNDLHDNSGRGRR